MKNGFHTMLLRALLAALFAFAASVGLLKASVLYENYALLGAGLVLAVAAVVLGMRRPGPAPA